MPFEAAPETNHQAQELVDDIEQFMKDGLPRVDPTAKKVYLRSGVVFDLQPISSLRLMRLYNNTSGKPVEPEPPMVEVLIGGTHKRLEPDPSDADYQLKLELWSQEMEEWERVQREKILIYAFTQGIVVDVPSTFVDEAAFFIGDNASPLLIKYEYICSLIEDDDIEFLMEAIVGQTVATSKGIEEAKSFFPGKG